MKTVAFLGSPRKDGNTELLLKETLRGIEDAGLIVQIFNLNSMNIQPCQDCGGCDKTGECVIHDDMDQIYVAIKSADRIILASPIFFLSLSAQTKAMIDRCQSFWYEKYILKKPVSAGRFGRKGLLLIVGGMKNETGMQCAEACVKAFFRTVSVSEHEILSITGIDKKGEILRYPAVLKDAYKAGKKLVKN